MVGWHQEARAGPHPVVGLHDDEAVADLAGGLAGAAARQRLREPRRRQPDAARRPARCCRLVRSW